MDVESPRLTVCMPVRNGAALVGRAISSALAQGFADFELIVSDNASTDGTAAIVAATIEGDARCRVITQRETLDVIRNFGATLAAARGDYVVFLAHDDWWAPDFLERLMMLADRVPDAQLLAPRACWVQPDGRQQMRPPFPDLPPDGFGRVRRLLRTAQADWFYGIYRRPLLARTFGLLEGYDVVWGWDHVVILPFLLTGKVVGDDQAITYQQAGGAGTTAHRPSGHAAQWRAFSGFLRRTIRIMEVMVPSPVRRLRLRPLLIGYANGRAWKLRRLVRSFIRERLLGRSVP